MEYIVLAVLNIIASVAFISWGIYQIKTGKMVAKKRKNPIDEPREVGLIFMMIGIVGLSFIPTILIESPGFQEIEPGRQRVPMSNPCCDGSTICLVPVICSDDPILEIPGASNLRWILQWASTYLPIIAIAVLAIFLLCTGVYDLRNRRVFGIKTMRTTKKAIEKYYKSIAIMQMTAAVLSLVVILTYVVFDRVFGLYFNFDLVVFILVSVIACLMFVVVPLLVMKIALSARRAKTVRKS